MTSSNLIRLGGLAAVTAGALLVIGELLYLIVGLSPGPEDLATISAELRRLPQPRPPRRIRFDDVIGDTLLHGIG